MYRTLDAVIARVNDVHVVIGVDRNPERPGELAWFRAAAARQRESATPLRDEFAVRVELLNAMAVRVGGVEIALAIEGDAVDGEELAVVEAEGSDLTDGIPFGSNFWMRSFCQSET